MLINSDTAPNLSGSRHRCAARPTPGKPGIGPNGRAVTIACPPPLPTPPLPPAARRRRARRDEGAAPEPPKPVAYPPNKAAEEYPDVWQNMAYIKSREEYDVMYQQSVQVGARRGHMRALAGRCRGGGWGPRGCPSNMR